MTHELKTLPEYFQSIWDGKKAFEARKNDRNYQVGDSLTLNEVEFGGGGMTDHDLTLIPTGRQIFCEVTYILPGGQFGIEKGYVVMSIEVKTKHP